MPDADVVTAADPSTGLPLAPIDVTPPSVVEAIVLRAHKAFRGDWSRNSAARAAALSSWADAIQREAESLENQLILETGKVRREARAEVRGCVDALRYNSGMSRYVGGRAGTLSDGSTAHVERQPVGVTLFITPWNWPGLLLLRDLAPALAAGVTAIVKPAPQTSHVTARILRLGHAAGVPEDVLCLAVGGADVGEMLLAHPLVRAVSFTGSTAVGQEILRAGASTFTRTLLELGGKGCSVIFSDADVEAAVAASVRSGTMTSGQMCLACTRLLVERSIFDAVRDAAIEALRALRVGPPADEASDLGPLISEQHRERVLGYVELAEAEGRVDLRGGKASPDGLEGWFLEPSLVSGVDPNSRVVRDEIFGPVLTIEPFCGDEAAAELANATDYGLTSGIWTADVNRAWKVATQLETGTVWINGYGPSFPEMPTGGFKHSGLGRTRGLEGIDQFTEIKHINWRHT